MRSRSDGFTLVELMVVVLIIGILVAIAVPVFNAAHEATARNACLANQRTIRGAIEIYRANNPDVADPTGYGPYDYHFKYPPIGSGISPWVERVMPAYIKSIGLCRAPQSAWVGGRTWDYCYAYEVTPDGAVNGCLWRLRPDDATSNRHSLP